MKIEIIDSGYFYADGGAMFGAIPKSAWQRKYPCDQTNCCILAIRSLLIKTADRIILIDTGVGKKHIEKLSWYRFFDMKDLREELQIRGTKPEDITDVILTHLHFDHCGNHFFPNATYWISNSQWNGLSSLHPLETSSVFKEEILYLEKTNPINLIEHSLSFTPEISLHLYDGHSKGQIVPFISTEKQDFIFAGDVIPSAAHLSPDWISAYDLSAEQSYFAKLNLLEQAISQNRAIIYSHDIYTPCSTIKKISTFFRPDKKLTL